jgi:hypothetical protein
MFKGCRTFMGRVFLYVYFLSVYTIFAFLLESYTPSTVIYNSFDFYTKFDRFVLFIFIKNKKNKVIYT